MKKEMIELEILYLQNRDKMTEFEKDIVLNTLKIFNVQLEKENE